MAEADGGAGDRRTGGLAVWRCLVLAGLAPGLADTGGVAVQVASPQLLAAGCGDRPIGTIAATPARAAIPAPVPSAAYHRWRASIGRHRPRPVAPAGRGGDPCANGRPGAPPAPSATARGWGFGGLGAGVAAGLAGALGRDGLRGGRPWGARPAPAPFPRQGQRSGPAWASRQGRLSARQAGAATGSRGARHLSLRRTTPPLLTARTGAHRARARPHRRLLGCQRPQPALLAVPHAPVPP